MGTERVGIPYAMSYLDAELRPYAECPRCGERCFGDTSSFADDEDELTKAPYRAYAEHWAQTHQD